MRFDDIAGQDHALVVLRRALAANRLAHAYLFDGPDGVGKRTAAIGLGLALLCPVAPGNGCGQCELCRRVLAGHHPDVFVFDAATLGDLAKASSDKSAVKYAARQVFPYALSAPHEARARVLVLDHADELSPDVQNTLLKTLEEPRIGVHIVLCTSARDRLLPTILSRTQRIRFLPLRAETLMTLAERRGFDRTRAETAAVLAGGSAAHLFTLLAAEGDVGPWAEVAELRRAAGTTGASAIFDTAAALGDKDGKQRLPEILALLAELYRDALAAAVGAPELVLLRQQAGEIEALAAAGHEGAGLDRLRRALRAVLDADEALTGNANAVVALEKLMIDLRPYERGVSGRARHGGERLSP